jgi:serine/threonine-protein kinase RsbW
MIGDMIKEVQVQGTEGYLSFLDGFVEGLRAEFPLSDDVASNVVISMSEALNNAFLHGNGGNHDLPITIRVFREGELISFSVLDSGDGFDYELLRDDLSDDLLDVPGGRGIFIMRALADGVSFNDQGNETTLKFRCA